MTTIMAQQLTEVAFLNGLKDYAKVQSVILMLLQLRVVISVFKTKPYVLMSQCRVEMLSSVGKTLMYTSSTLAAFNIIDVNWAALLMTNAQFAILIHVH